MRLATTLSLAALLLIGVALTPGCGGDDDDNPTSAPAAAAATATPAAAPNATDTTAPSTTAATAGSGQSVQATTAPASTADAALDDAINAVAGALADHDRDRLRDHTGGHLQLRDQDFNHLMDCVPDGATIEPVSRTFTVNGDEATVVMTLEVTEADGTISTVERTWLFERDADGTWKLSELPDCPFHD